ncbi:type III pantothenate kinase [Flavobacterium sp. 3HN19-14]|uniref:type III pantothenate kinase n=1 Tax=Flavobacterium sp. 3HN19-14 TaxID=3448133 RepID=UPI003EE33C46
MILTIDVGNTRIKGAVFENDTIVAHFVFDKNELKNTIEKILNTHSKITDILVASVGDIEKVDFLNFKGQGKCEVYYT